MRVRVDERRHDRHTSQIDRPGHRRAVDGDDPAILD